jgi:hypothetical protein
MNLMRILILAAVAGSMPALAQTETESEVAPATALRNNAIVYKCTNADGSVVYSAEPCSNDPKKVQTIDTSPALRTGSGGHQGEIAASVADSDCREGAYRITHGNSDRIEISNRQIAEYRQRQRDLDQRYVHASDGSADLVPDPESAKAIADLDAAIAHEVEFQQKEHDSLEQEYQKAIKVCDDAEHQQHK